MEEKFDVIIVGAGIAGCVAAYLLAKEGLEVVLIERGNFIGAKNTSGGRIYAHSIEEIFPNFADEAPIERLITHERLSFMNENDNTTLEYALNPDNNPKKRSYSVLRAKFDAWLGEKAEEAGANIILGVRVDELIKKDNKVCGVIAGGEEMYADVVLICDGANSLLCDKNDLGAKVNPHTCAVGVKEIIELGKEKIQDRFNCESNEGVAWLFAGSVSAGYMGGGFLYTNKDSLSLGVVFGLHNANKCEVSVPQMLENFKNHKAIAPLIKDGKMVEYSAHIVPEGGLKAIKKLSDDGVLVLGDAAGLCLNIGYCVRGMDLSVLSAIAATKAVINAKQNNNFTKESLKLYDKELSDSFVLKDMKLYQRLPEFLDNERIFNEYPKMISAILQDMFIIDGASKPLRQKIFSRAKNVGLINILKDMYKGVKAI